MTLVVNLFGGPGSGKSTCRAGIFSQLKLHSVDCEEAYEYAKEATWENKQHTLKDQTYVFGKQYHRQWLLKNQVDVVVTDSPILMTLAYGTHTIACTKAIVEKFNEFDNLNFFIRRIKPYKSNGRNETELQSAIIGERIKTILEVYKYPYVILDGNWLTINKITNQVLTKLDITHEIGLGDLTENDL